MNKIKDNIALLNSGVLELRRKNINSFIDIEVPNIISYLDVSNNKITDFFGFTPPSHLNTLILDGNPILSFQNFPIQHQIQSISCFQTPISQHPHFRLLALFALGSKLKRINEVDVTTEELIFLSDEKLKSFIKSGNTNSLMSRFSSIIRSGWIGNFFPISLDEAEKETIKSQNYPISMKIMKLAKILKLDENNKKYIFEVVFSDKNRVKTVKPPKSIMDKLKKQQMMIEYLQTELDDLKKEKKKEDMKIVEQKEISKENEEKYEEIIDEFGFILNENESKVEQTREERDQLRELAKLSIGRKKSDKLSDKELASLLTKKFLHN